MLAFYVKTKHGNVKTILGRMLCKDRFWFVIRCLKAKCIWSNRCHRDDSIRRRAWMEKSASRGRYYRVNSIRHHVQKLYLERSLSFGNSIRHQVQNSGTWSGRYDRVNSI